MEVSPTCPPGRHGCTVTSLLTQVASPWDRVRRPDGSLGRWRAVHGREIRARTDPDRSQGEPQIVVFAPTFPIARQVFVQKRSGAPERTNVRDTSVGGDHIVVVREHVPKAEPNQLDQFFIGVHRFGLVLTLNLF
jgi:hypothetical protein